MTLFFESITIDYEAMDIGKILWPGVNDVFVVDIEWIVFVLLVA